MRVHRAIGEVRAVHGVEMQPAHLWMVSMLAHVDIMPLLDPPAVRPTWQDTHGSRESIGSGGRAAGTPWQKLLYAAAFPGKLPTLGGN